MNISVEILGLPMITELMGKRNLEMDIAGGTVKEIVDELIRRYGAKVRDVFCDPEGNFDLSIQASLNGKSFISRDEHQKPLLREGDRLIFMLLLAGG